MYENYLFDSTNVAFMLQFPNKGIANFLYLRTINTMCPSETLSLFYESEKTKGRS